MAIGPLSRITFRVAFMENVMFKKIAFGAVASLASVAAFADVPAGVTTAITSAGTDAGTVGAAVLVVLVGIVAFKWLKKAL